MDTFRPKAAPAALLIDDEELYLRILTEHFRARGYAVTARRDLDGAERAFAELAAQGPVPLVIVDLVQPGDAGGYLGGLDLLRRLPMSPETEVVALSDSEADWLLQTARSLGARRALSKPDLRRTPPEHLDRALRSFLDVLDGRVDAAPLPPDDSRPGLPTGADETLLGALEEMRHLRDRTSILLLVMRLAANLTHRGLIYEIEGDRLRALGGFGLQDEPTGTADRRLALDRDTLPGRAFWSGRLQRTGGAEGAGLLPPLGGAPPREAIALPVLGPDGVVAVIYADTAGSPSAMPDLRPLSALAGTASLALARLQDHASPVNTGV